MDRFVCWTRMGSESGEGLAAIVARKEQERRSTGGVFFWGIGNPLGQAPAYAAAVQGRLAVLFSRMKSAAKSIDHSPEAVLQWTAYRTADGTHQRLPQGVLVTSRAVTPSGAPKGRHYALVCRSDVQLTLGSHGLFDPTAYRNLGGGGQVGPSQVTCLLERVANPSPSEGYEVAMVAELVAPYFVQLVDPVPYGDLECKSLLRRTA